MDTTTLQIANKSEERLSSKQSQSLYQMCHQVVDGRKKRGMRYDLAGMFLVIVLAKLAGMNGILSVSEWATNQEEVLRQCFGLETHAVCEHVQDVLAVLESQQVNAQLAAWFVRQDAQQHWGEEPGWMAAEPSERHVHLAIDGKTLKGTGTQAYRGEDPQQHVLHVYEVKWKRAWCCNRSQWGQKPMRLGHSN